ncbi:nuclease [bacterium]|jgi:endonuclease YncB( thermonuclease family)|nr:nuclease [bacterium]MBT4597791.1 nuclease [bacterium]MBT7431753.1 nuclease [bacterium]
MKKTTTLYNILALLAIIAAAQTILLIFIKQDVSTEDKKSDNQIIQVASEKTDIFYPVLHVYDGDTISIDKNSSTERIRLIGIDSPETSEKYREKECFGEEAAKKAVELLSGKKIRIEADPTQADVDIYGRSLRYVFLEDGTFLNQKMIEEGFAKEYTFKESAYKYQKDFLVSQEEAKKAKKGLWNKCNE